MKVGTFVKLKNPIVCLKLKVGDWGMCFHEYDLGEGPAGQVIFTNGEYDGFSPEEQEHFLTIMIDSTFQYKFTNVITLSRDFDRGKFEYLKLIENFDKQMGESFAKACVEGHALLMKDAKTLITKLL